MPFINKNLVNTHRKRVCYNRQHNLCVNLLRKTKKDYYGNLNEKDMTEILQNSKTSSVRQGESSEKLH